MDWINKAYLKGKPILSEFGDYQRADGIGIARAPVLVHFPVHIKMKLILPIPSKSKR